MSREAKLGIGGLLLLVALVIASLPILDSEPRKNSQAIAVMVGIFGLPGLAIFVWGMLPRLGPAGRRYVRLRFLPGRVGIGLLVTVASAGVLYLFNEVVHVAPKALIIGALMGIPIGILWAAMGWAEWCIRCNDEVSRAPDGRRYCARCREYVLDPRTKQVVTGVQAKATIETLLLQPSPAGVATAPGRPAPPRR